MYLLNVIALISNGKIAVMGTEIYNIIINAYAKVMQALLVHCTPVPVRINSTYDLHKSSKDFIK